jgi:hypothetical protein
MTSPADVPELPQGRVLKLHSGEWAHCHNLPNDAYCDLTVVKVFRSTVRIEDGHTWVWVSGHAMECSWVSSTCTIPCINLMVRLDVLQRHAG